MHRCIFFAPLDVSMYSIVYYISFIISIIWKEKKAGFLGFKQAIPS